MNFNQLKKLADKRVFSMEGITVMKTEEYEYRLQQIEELTSNWNELKEHLRSRFNEWIGSKNEIIREGACEDYRILDYMEYLEGGSDVQSNNQNEI